MNVDKVVEYWVKTSIYDLETAEDLFRIGKYPYALFMCHMAIEKLLKAVAVKVTSEHANRTHNLVYLTEKTKLKFDDTQLDLLAEMNEFNIEARYPDEKMSFYEESTQEYTSGYLERTMEMHKWLTRELRKL